MLNCIIKSNMVNRCPVVVVVVVVVVGGGGCPYLLGVSSFPLIDIGYLGLLAYFLFDLPKVYGIFLEEF